MARGRKRKPTAILKMQGTFRPGVHNEAEPDFGDTVPQPPRSLSGAARSEWRRLAPVLARSGLLTVADRAALATYCEAWADWKAARKLIDAEGLVLIEDTKSGEIHKSHPAVRICREAETTMRHCARQFGLSPSDRAAISSPLKARENAKAQYFDARTAEG